MNRWIVRLFGLALILILLGLLMHLQRRLVEIQREQAPVTTTT